MYIVPIGGSMLTLSQIEVNSMFFCGIRVSFSVLCFADIVCLFLFVVVLSNLFFGLWLPLSVCRCIVYPSVLACDYHFLFVVVLSILLFWLVITPFCLSYCLSCCFGLWLPLSVCRCIVYPSVLACDYPFLFVVVLSILLFRPVITPLVFSNFSYTKFEFVTKNRTFICLYHRDKYCCTYFYLGIYWQGPLYASLSLLPKIKHLLNLLVPLRQILLHRFLI